MMRNTREIPSSSRADDSATPVEVMAKARLLESPYLELRRLACSLQGNTLHLKGPVSSFYLRQIVQTLMQGIEGVEKVVYQLDVASERARHQKVPV